MQKIKQIALASIKHWREIFFVYLIQLLVGLGIGITMLSSMCSSLGESMVLDQLAKGFDRTVIMDVLFSNPDALDSAKGMAIILLGVYLLQSVWLQAGWLANIRNRNYSIRSLMVDGLKNFLPFLGIALISILLIVIFGAVVGISFTKTVGDPLVTFSSEKPYVIWIVVLSCIFILWSILIWSWSVSTRLHYIGGKTYVGALKAGLRSVFAKLMKYMVIGLLIVGIHVLLMFMYYWIMGDRGAPSWCIVIFGIFVQQIFAIIRLALRGFGYSLVDDLTFDLKQ